MSTIDHAFDLAELLSEEEKGWTERVREFAARRVQPTIDDDYEHKRFRRELVAEFGQLGVLGMHITGYG